MAETAILRPTAPNDSDIRDQLLSNSTISDITTSDFAPGPVAALPQYLADESVSLRITRDPLSKHWSITRADGSVMFVAQSGHFVSSLRDTLVDNEGNKLYQIRREFYGFRTKYYAETTEGGPRLFEMELHTRHHVVQASTMFHNVAENGR
jgi:hypothetical protein